MFVSSCLQFMHGTHGSHHYVLVIQNLCDQSSQIHTLVKPDIPVWQPVYGHIHIFNSYPVYHRILTSHTVQFSIPQYTTVYWQHILIGHALVHEMYILHNKTEEGDDPASLLRLVCLADGRVKRLPVVGEVADGVYKTLWGNEWRIVSQEPHSDLTIPWCVHKLHILQLSRVF